jgi:hypothetical protein
VCVYIAFQRLWGGINLCITSRNHPSNPPASFPPFWLGVKSKNKNKQKFLFHFSNPKKNKIQPADFYNLLLGLLASAPVFLFFLLSNHFFFKFYSCTPLQKNISTSKERERETSISEITTGKKGERERERRYGLDFFRGWMAFFEYQRPVPPSNSNKEKKNESISIPNTHTSLPAILIVSLPSVRPSVYSSTLPFF